MSILMSLGEVADYCNGRTFKPSEWEKTGLPIIRIQNLTGQSDKYNRTTRTFEDQYRVQNGDLLFSWSATLDAFIWQGGNAWLNQHIFRVRPYEGIDKKYLYYYLKEVVSSLYRKTHGSGMVHITKKPFMETKIPVPSLDVQQQIVSHIEELFSDLDDGVATLEKTKKELELYRQAVLKDVFSQYTSMIPFGNIMDSRLGKMLDKKKNVGKYRTYLRNINVRWFTFDLNDLLEMRITDAELEGVSLHKGDLVICEGGEPGRCAVWNQDEEICFQKALHRVRFLNGDDPSFYMYYLWYLAHTGELEKYFTGTGIKHLTGESLQKVEVPSAKISQQKMCMQLIEERLSVCDEISASIDTTLHQASSLRQSILKKAFEGELVHE